MDPNRISIIVAKIALALFCIVSLGELYSQLTDWRGLHLYTKPLLMPLLTVYTISMVSVSLNKNILFTILGALFFSWLGDSFLMYQQKDDGFFMLGLGCFFAAHVLYIIMYRQISHRPVVDRYVLLKRLLSLVFIAFGLGLVWLIWGGLAEMKLPVAAYATVLIIMGIGAVWRFDQTNFPSFMIVLAGAILFIISDSIIALDKFYLKKPNGGFWVMLTYISAQYLIVYGALKHEKAD
jgi:uncharacterized membrane protein YhhN